MRVLVISDTHFAHRALVEKLNARPPGFEARIQKHWRRMVSNEDLIIHLGDVVVGTTGDWCSHVPTLLGRNVLMLGNHDRNTLSWYMTHGFDFCCNEFSWKIRAVGDFDLNVHGHLHLGRHREYERDHRHFLVALEHTGYQPMTLTSIVKEWKQTS